MREKMNKSWLKLNLNLNGFRENLIIKFTSYFRNERGDVPGWVLVVLMTTGLVTAIWTIAQPRISTILRNSLDNMNNIR